VGGARFGTSSGAATGFGRGGAAAGR
jgi:hypothetical protein